MKFGDKHGFEAPDYFPQFKDAAADHLGAIQIYEVYNLIILSKQELI